MLKSAWLKYSADLMIPNKTDDTWNSDCDFLKFGWFSTKNDVHQYCLRFQQNWFLAISFAKVGPKNLPEKWSLSAFFFQSINSYSEHIRSFTAKTISQQAACLT